MTSRKTILFIVAAILLIIVILMQMNKPKAAEVIESEISVVVASHDIPPYTILSREHLTTGRAKAADAVDSFDRVEEIIGKMTTTEVRARSIVQRSGILPLDSSWSDDTLVFSFYVPTARIIGGQLRPGHHIDLLATRAENRDQLAESMWLARNLWVVGVYQASGADVPRPSVGAYESSAPAEEKQPTRATGLNLSGGLSLSGSRAVEGPANLVVLAAHRETARMIGDYLGARLYDPWLYVRPTGSSASAQIGRIDGVVFSDDNRNLMQERTEQGLDGVQITLFDNNNVSKKVIQTMGGGQFSFDDLAAGTYYVEEQDPAGYVSVSPNKLMLVVAAGQNQHVIFANAPQPPPPTALPTPEPVAAPAPKSGAAIGPVTPPCQAALVISDKEGGAAAPQPFPDGTSQVWAVINFQGCAEDLGYSLVAYAAREGEAKGIPYTGNLKGINGSVSVKVTPWGGATEFAPGSYAAVLRLGPENILTDFATWAVGSTVAALPVLTSKDAGYPVTGQEAADEPPTHFGFERSQ